MTQANIARVDRLDQRMRGLAIGLWSVSVLLLLAGFLDVDLDGDDHAVILAAGAIVAAAAAHSATSEVQRRKMQRFYVRVTDMYHGKGTGLTSSGAVELAELLVDPQASVDGTPVDGLPVRRRESANGESDDGRTSR